MSSTAPAPTDGPPIGRWLSSGLILTSCGFWYLFLVTRASWLSVRAQGCTADLLDAGGMFAHRLEVLGVAGVVWLLSLLLGVPFASRSSSLPASWWRVGVVVLIASVAAIVVALVFPHFTIPDDYCRLPGA